MLAVEIYLQPIRPVSYIRQVINPTWLPLIGTPAHPEFAYTAAKQSRSCLHGSRRNESMCGWILRVSRCANQRKPGRIDHLTNVRHRTDLVVGIFRRQHKMVASRKAMPILA